MTAGRSIPRALLGLATLGALALPGLGCRPRIVNRCPRSEACPSSTAKDPHRQGGRSISPQRRLGFKAPRRFMLPNSVARPRTLAISPRGDRIAIGGRWGGLQVVRVVDGRVLHSLGQTEELANGLVVKFTRTGKHLISARHFVTMVRIWNAASGRLERQFRVKGFPIRDLAVGPQNLAVIATGKGAEIWNLATGKHVRTESMRFDLPVIRVAAAGSGILALGDRAGNIRVTSFDGSVPGGRLASPGSRLTGLDLSEDGKLLATAYENKYVRLATTSPVRRIRAFVWRASSRPVKLRLSQDSSKLVVAERIGRIAHLDTRNGNLLFDQRQHLATLTDASVSRDGELVATVTRQGRIHVWQSEDSPKRLALPERYKPKARPLPKATIRVVQPSRIVLDTPGVSLTSFALGRRGQFLAVGGVPTQVAVYYLDWTPRRGGVPRAKRLYSRKLPAPEAVTREPFSVAITPNRTWLFAQGRGQPLWRWALVSGRRIRMYSHRMPSVRGLLPMHDNRRLITLAGRQVIGLSLNGRRRFRFSGVRDAYWIGVPPKGRAFLMIQGWDRLVTYNLPSGRKRWDRPSGLLAEFEVLAVGFANRAKQLLTFHRTGFLRVYDLAGGILIAQRRVPMPEDVRHCTFRPDGRILACAHPRGVTLVEVPRGAIVRTLSLPRARSKAKVRGLAYSPKGNALVAQTARQQVVIYNFDRPGTVKRYTGVEAAVRIRLGLPLVPPRVVIPTSKIPKRGLLKPRGPLRKRQPTPRPPRHSVPTPPSR